MKPESTTWFRYVVGFFQSYGGFMLGALTVPLILTYEEPISDWIEQLPNGSGYYPPDWWWAPVLVSSLLTNFLGSLIAFGPCTLLGGLLGRHPLRSGILICLALLTILLVVSSAVRGTPVFEDHWFHYIVFPLSYLIIYLGVLLPYLLGFSLKRLVLLSVFSPAKK